MAPNPKIQHESDDMIVMHQEPEHEFNEKTHVPIAICGYSYRLPGGLDSDEAFWDLLVNRGYIQESVADRYGPGEVPWDGFTESPMRLASPFEAHIKDGRDLEFDCALFGVSVHDAKRMDPQIKMMLMVTWEALQCAGYDQAALHNSRTGVFAGQQTSSVSGWRAVFGAHPADVPGKCSGMIANRISFHFNWMGPSFSVATACSSGITALDAAIKSLDKGECDLAAFGAVHYLGQLQSSIGFNHLGIISKTGSSRSFDKDANGYMRSEGAFMYLIKRLADAERDGDRIFGVIRGCGLNTAGAELDAEILTPGRMIVAPVGHAQQTLMEKIARQAGIDPLMVDYIEAHATGTVVGDSIEGNAIANVYGSPNRKMPLRIASARSNLGHMEAASFTLSLLKVILMLQRRQFAPISSHFKEATEKIPFAAQKMRVLTDAEPFPNLEDRPVTIGINSFGFGGANGHCLIEEYEMPSDDEWSKLPQPTDDKVFMAPLSAKSEEALIENARRLAQTVSNFEGDFDLYTLIGNLSTRMTHHRVRTALTAISLTDFKDKLTAFVERADLNELKPEEISRIQLHRGNDSKPNERGNIVMIFPGQGSQWAGCGRELYETELVFRRVVDIIDAEWIKYAGCKLSEVAFDENVGDKLNDCFWAQPVTFLLQVGMYELFKAHGVHPKAVIGHSAGEASAAYASGFYSLEEACCLVYHRSRLQSKLAGCGRMLVLMLNSTAAEEMLASYGFSDDLEIACFNSPCNTVVCGTEDKITQFREKLEAEGKPTGTLIAGNIAFHSRFMEPIKEELFESLSMLDGPQPRKAKIPMISTVTGNVVKDMDAEYWWSNVRQPVNMIAAITTARVNIQPEVMIEISPHITLRSPIRDCFEDAKEPMPSYIYTLVRKSNAADMFTQSIGSCFKTGVPLKFHKLYPRPRPITYLLPNYAMKRERVIDDHLDERHFRKAENFSGGPLLGSRVLHDHPFYGAVMSKFHFAWMKDHVVQGTPLVPAAAYMELLFECYKGKPVHIVNARILAPCVIGMEPEYLSSELIPCAHAPYRSEAKIFSRKHDYDSNENKIHCLGVIEEITDDNFDDILPQGLPRNLADDDGDYIECRYETGKDFYTTMSARIGHSFSYGPYFQTVSRVDSDPFKRKDRLEVTLDADLWKKWDNMGYLFHPSMLDGALQSFLIYVMEASDFSGVPQMIKNLVFICKPTSEKIIVIYKPPEYLRKNFHRKGQLAFGLGERSAGSCSIYDAATGVLCAHLGDYTVHHSDSKKSDLRKLKHCLSWQPKDGCKIEKTLPVLVSAFENGSGINEVTKLLIEDLMKTGNPNPASKFFVNAGEIIIGELPEKLAMDHCMSSLLNAPVQYSLLSENTEFLSESFQKYGTANQDAHLRFLESNEADSAKQLLRPAVFELLVIRAKKAATEEEEQQENSAETEVAVDGDNKDALVSEEELKRLASFVAPGGIIVVESYQALTYPSDWTAVWQAISNDSSSPSHAIFRAAPFSPVKYTREVESNTEPDASGEATAVETPKPVVIRDELGFAEKWMSIVDVATTSDVDFEFAKSWQRIDYFAMDDSSNLVGDDPELFTAAVKLTEFIKELFVYRNGVEGVVPCVFTVFTSGAMLNVKSPSQTGVWGAVRSLALEIGDGCKLDFRLLDVATKEDLQFAIACEPMRERELCVHNGHLWTSRLINDRQSLPMASLSSEDESAYNLHTDYSGLLADLEFRVQELPVLSPLEIEVSVKASALNFRDIMVGLGRLPLLSYEASALGRTVGMECAGVVVRCGSDVKDHKVGDKVLAMQGGCIANRIRCHEKAAYRMPANLSFEEGSSLASVYITAYYGLIYLSRMREGQSILVHSALGGVGQAAIALAKLKGAKVYGTAGSEEKRQALRDMGCVDAFDSHSTKWFQDLMKSTQGKGVNIVLNSLAGEHVDLCLEALAPGGWHCEIGKVDIFADRPVKLAVFRKNIAYRAIDIDRLMTDDPYLVGELMHEIMSLIETKQVPTLPYTKYCYSEFHEALRCMMNGQHRGKLVLTPPAPEVKLSVVDCRPVFGRAIDTSSDNRTVIMSGCLGGFGLRVLAYVVALGARNIVLLDRDPALKRSVEWIREKSYISYLLGDVTDLRIEVIYADVGKYSHVVEAVSAVERLGMPPIGSVFHLAGILDDKLVTDIDRDSFAKVYEPKANGAWNLHRATSHIDTIEHFVMFSSTSSAFGNPGQTNYSAANSFQDGLAAMRVADGKPALSFCMGAVIETGMASRNPQLLQMMKAGGMPAISCIFAIEALDAAIKTSKHWNTVACLADDFPANMGSNDFLRCPAQLIRNNAAFKVGGGAAMSRQALIEILSTRVGALCGVEQLDPSEPFSSYGLNSISVAELVAYLKNEMSYTVSAMELMTSATCESIADGILKAQAGEDNDEAEKPADEGTEATGQETEVDSDADEENNIWNQPLVEEPSLFEPRLQEYFSEPMHAAKSLPKQVVKPIVKLDSGKADTEATSVTDPSNMHGNIDGVLPKQCQETLDVLIGFVESLDVSAVKPAVPVEKIRRVMLTGATGFVGRHLIADILNFTDKIELIYCPVRARDDENALERVIQAMTESDTWDDKFLPRLRVFKGDLAEESFGTSADLHDEMLRSIDAVYHLAANLNLTSSFEDLRDSNCYPMRGVLSLCLSIRKKHLFLASTLGIFPQYFCQFSNEMADKPITRDCMPDVNMMKRVFPLVIGGYQWTKFLVELVSFKAAQAKGLPLAVFRLPAMFTNSQSGYSFAGDPTVNLLFASLEMRQAPVQERPLKIEDSAVQNEMMVRISLNPNRKNVIYHLSAASLPPVTEASTYSMMGYSATITSYEAFKARCLKKGSDSQLNMYWLLLDHMAPWWIKYKKLRLEFPIDVSTIEEDCHPVPARSNALKCLSRSMEWAFRHKELSPFDLNLLRASTDFDSVILPARRLCSEYNLDFDTVVPSYVREGLHRICDENHAPIHRLPEVSMYLTSRLESRVHMYRLFERHPEILNEPIESPLFVLGMNRTGTTLVQRMVEASGHFECLHVEETCAIPKVEQLISPDPEVEQKRLEFVKSMLYGYVTSALGIHEIEIGVADEDMVAHSGTFMSPEFHILYDLPKYKTWLESLDLTDVYKEHKRWMQFVSWSRRRANPTFTSRWCFKMPFHLRSLQELINTYPDARFVHTHRDLEHVTGSWCSLVERQRERFVETIDRDELGLEQLSFIESTLSAGMNFRKEHPELENRWLDVAFNDVVSNPVDMAVKVLAHAGVTVDSATTSVISNYVKESMVKHQNTKLHSYDMRDYGLKVADFEEGDLLVYGNGYQSFLKNTEESGEVPDVPDMYDLEKEEKVAN